jgi:CheY-like chemotaxis protein
MPDTTLLHGKRILVVDDEPDVIDVLEEMLNMCEVTKASTYDEARAHLEKRNFDLAILDIMGVDGYKLLNIAKRRNITAVMLTAHALSPDNLEKSVNGGADSYLPKEKMSNITTFLVDILKSQKEGESPWVAWREKLASSYFGRKWGSEWQRQNQEFWDKLNSKK